MSSVSMRALITLAIFTAFTTAAVLGNPPAVIGGNGAAKRDGANTALVGSPCCFGEDCLDWSLDSTGHVLEGTCYNKLDQRGHWTKVKSSLDLSNCIGNFNGILRPAPTGGYSQTCTDCKLQDTNMTCDCKTPTGKLFLATVDLNNFVQDYNGYLKCFNFQGGTTNQGTNS